MWLDPWACEGAAPRQVRGSCSPRSRPLQYLRAQNEGLSLIHGGPCLVPRPTPTPTPAGPLLFSFLPTQLGVRLPGGRREGRRGRLVQVVCDPGPAPASLPPGPGQERGWVLCCGPPGDGDAQERRAEAASGVHGRSPQPVLWERRAEASGQLAGGRREGSPGPGSGPPGEALAAQGTSSPGWGRFPT